MKQKVAAALLAVLCGGCLLPVHAQEEVQQSPSFDFVLLVDGEESWEASCGEIVTVTLRLDRTDADQPYPMYAMQDEIQYDETFFELIPGSAVLADQVTGRDLGGTDEHRAYYMNYLSMGGGDQWAASTIVGTIRLRVIGTSGVARITSRNALVSRKDGTGSEPCTVNEAKVIVSTDCTVRFESRGGNAVPDQTVQYGDKILPPETPSREGHRFAGWYRDIDLTEPWDFEQDVVQNNMTLYAAWTEGEQLPNMVSDTGVAVWLVPALAGIAAAVVIVALCRKQAAEHPRKHKQ